MSVALGPFAIVAAVLAVSGLFKLRDPAPTSEMLRSLGLPASPLLARLVGTSELLVGAAAVLLGGRALALAVALGYGFFAAVTGRLLSLGDAAASCGCFGRLSARPSGVHVAVNVMAASVAVVALVADVPGFLAARDQLEYAGLPAVALVALGSWLLMAVLTVLPATMEAARRGPRSPAIRTFEVTDGSW